MVCDVTLHYHGTPITPVSVFYEMAGRCFCVSHADPRDVARAHEVGQSVMLDNGAYSAWTAGRAASWDSYYSWCEEWLSWTTWAVVPDVIDGSVGEQDVLLAAWPHPPRHSAPVWHMNEPVSRLLHLCEGAWHCVCVGSTSQYRQVMSPAWQERMDDALDECVRVLGRVPPLHMLRGMWCAGERWPFMSVDSTDVARNHASRCGPAVMARRWDSSQCPVRWFPVPRQRRLIA